MVMESTILVNCCHQLIVMDTDWYFLTLSHLKVFSSSFVNIKMKLPCPLVVVNLHDEETAIM